MPFPRPIQSSTNLPAATGPYTSYARLCKTVIYPFATSLLHLSPLYGHRYSLGDTRSPTPCTCFLCYSLMYKADAPFQYYSATKCAESASEPPRPSTRASPSPRIFKPFAQKLSPFPVTKRTTCCRQSRVPFISRRRMLIVLSGIFCRQRGR